MAAFTISYRLPSGGLKSEVIDAADRASALAQMRSRGITPISVKEGGKLATASTSASKPAWIKGAVAGLLVVIAAVIAFVCLGPTENAVAPKVEKPKKEKVGMSKPFPRVKSVQKSVATNAESVLPPVAVVPVADPAKRYHKGVEVISSQAKTNKNGTVVEKLQLANGKTIERVVPPKPIFEAPSDQLIALALSARMGQSMPPLPGLGAVDRDFASSLAIPISISPDDPPEVRELKLKVKEARAYIAAEVGSGRTVRQCLEEHCQRMEQIADDHQMALDQIVKMRQAGASAKEIAEFRDRVNELFREKGTPELPVSQRKGAVRSDSSSGGGDAHEVEAQGSAEVSL